MAKFVFLSLLFIPTELVLGEILQDENFHPEANLLLSPAEVQGFFFTIQNWLFFSEEVLGCWALRFCCSTLDSEVDGDHVHGTWHLLPLAAKQTKDWKLSYFSTTNSQNFVVEFGLEWVFSLSWKNRLKDAKVYLNCIGRQYKPIPMPYHAMQEES